MDENSKRFLDLCSRSRELYENNIKAGAKLEVLIDYHERLASAFSATSSSDIDALLVYTKQQLRTLYNELEQGIAAWEQVQAEIDAFEMSQEWSRTLERIRGGMFLIESPDSA